ncbi:MAG: DUF86 domain-containing protein [candidate division KSB1 bacterium]|nr:DUF86 domain-containing protein [candidate division KSB1 bacterium]
MQLQDKEIIYKRLNKLEKELKALEKHSSVSLEQYLEDGDLQAVVERRLQVLAQIAMDIGNYLVTRKRLEIPEEEENVFIVLGKAKILSWKLSQKMKGLVRFRNILVHNYLEIDPEIVYENLKNNLSDFRKFAEEISKYLGEP